MAGKNDSEETDRIRDTLDQPWYAMTDLERERIGQLSEELQLSSDAMLESNASSNR